MGKSIRSYEPSVLAAVAVLLSVIVTSGSWAATADAPEPSSDESLVASVSVENITATIETLQAFGSREFHLESSKQAAEYLLGALEDVGVPAELQHFLVEDTPVSNVVGTLQGSDPDAGTYLFGAHYDSENYYVHNLSTAENISAPGADDDASGVAAVLELARILAGSDYPGTVKFVMFGAEEMGYDRSGGLKGSQYFVDEEVTDGRRYSGTAILDMVGYRSGEQNNMTLVVNDEYYGLAKSTRQAAGAFQIDLEIDVLVAPKVTYSDHSSFWAEGIPSMLVIEELDVFNSPVNPMYHTSYDTVDTLSLEQVVAVTQVLLGGLLLDDDGDDRLLLFGTVLMSAAIVTVALFVFIRRRRGLVEDDR